MDTIVVSGKASGVGKTTLIGRIIKNLGCRTGVIKTSLQTNLKEVIVTDSEEVILNKGSDTVIFKEAGADRVVFLKSDYHHLKESLERARELIKGVDYLLIEGNSILDYLNPDLIIYLTSKGLEAKPSAVKAEARADIIIDNSNHILEDNEVAQGDLPDELFLQKGLSFNADHISCHKAHLIARVLGYKPAVIGRRLDEAGIRIKNCQLGLF